MAAPVAVKEQCHVMRRAVIQDVQSNLIYCMDQAVGQIAQQHRTAGPDHYSAS